MTVSTTTLTPTTTTRPVPLALVGPVVGAGADAETTTDRFDTIATAARRAGRDDYWQWLHHVQHVGECTHPIKLRGKSHTIDPSTGEILATRDTTDMPDAAVYVRCGNRRATVCPSCAELYRADTYQLVRAGLAGGKTVPESVRDHVAVFVTLTAPSFGLVHSRWAKPGQPSKPCRPRRKPDLCPHGVDLRCFRKHGETEKALGLPLCLDCYDHDHQAVWNLLSGELWRRTTDHIKTHLKTWAKTHGERVRISYAKVAEMQARGLVHFHALIRLDGHDPDDPSAITTPPEHATHFVLEHAIRQAAEQTTVVSPSHPDNREGWAIAWGKQVDVRPIRMSGQGEVTDTQVAGYLAKYATKATETTGHASARLTDTTVDLYRDLATHAGRLIDACWRLGRPVSNRYNDSGNSRLSYRRLRRWAHMLGFGGHFSTKSRYYSTTLRALREARCAWRRQHHRLAEHLDAEPETTLIVNAYSYADTGWHTTGDALLASTAAAKAREHRDTIRDQLDELRAHEIHIFNAA